VDVEEKKVKTLTTGRRSWRCSTTCTAARTAASCASSTSTPSSSSCPCQTSFSCRISTGSSPVELSASASSRIRCTSFKTFSIIQTNKAGEFELFSLAYYFRTKPVGAPHLNCSSRMAFGPTRKYNARLKSFFHGRAIAYCSRGLYYKTYYGNNLRILIIS